jgi:hypothetical protein
MKPAEDIERIVKEMSFRAGAETNQRLWAEVRKAQEQSPTRTTAPSRSRLRRIIMRNPRIRWAAAAVTILVVVLSISLWNKSIPAAYALEQTIEASRSVRYLEIRDFRNETEEPKKFWVELDDAGQIRRTRFEIPAWDSPGDGPKVSILKGGKATVWLKAKKTMVTIQEEGFANRMMEIVRLLDPQLALQHFSEWEKAGLAQIQIDQPANRAEPITVTSTKTPQGRNAGFADRTVLTVDQTTKLVTKIEKYQLTSNGSYESLGRTEFYPSREPFAPGLFTLDDVPADVMRIDQTVQEVGLDQGDLSDQEIAVQVVREFFEALNAKDYAKAGRLMGGIPAGKVEQMLGNAGIVRIISIGTPQPDPTLRGKRFFVPCQVEFQGNGVKSTEDSRVSVRTLDNQPQKWIIAGGI